MIAILSDFGSSEYLGVMKAAIYAHAPDARITDLCNEIPCHDITSGAWILMKNYHHFPKGTIFLCVVDPGVGTSRQAVAVKTRNYLFVGPDNGLMHPAAKKDRIMKTIELDTTGASMTFHGRDVFAPAAAKLEKGMKITELGPTTHLQVRLDLEPKAGHGKIMWIDRFGNIITNLHADGREKYTIRIHGKDHEMRFHKTYHSAHESTPFLIEGSSGTLEISCRSRKATSLIHAPIGEKVRIL